MIDIFITTSFESHGTLTSGLHNDVMIIDRKPAYIFMPSTILIIGTKLSEDQYYKKELLGSNNYQPHPYNAERKL